MELLETAKEDVKQAADIVDVIGRYVRLKKAGRNHQGLCPFHSEKEPSFSVSREKQRFHCYGCKKGGDVFAFWMEYHGVSFAQSLQDLAARYQVSLPEPKRTPAQEKRFQLRESLFKLNGMAADFYHRILTETRAGEPGRSYIQGRGIDESTLKGFKLGYAPDRWDGLSRYLKNKNADMDRAVEAGLIIERNQGGWYDRFRGRLVFPIFTTTQRIAGFGARVLDHALPKYLNTPETPVFRKGEILYGLHAAGPSIRRSRRALVVEGYTDVLALHRMGLSQAVATLGTALTRDHIRRLKGYSDEVVVVFDSDTAGKSAAVKSLPFFLAEGLSSRVLILPEGEDPDSFMRTRGPDDFASEVENAASMFDYFVDVGLDSAGDSEEARLRALREILLVLAELEDRTLGALYVHRLSERTSIPEATIIREMESSASGRSNHRIPDAISTSRPGIDERHLLHLLLHYPEATASIMESGWDLLVSNPAVRAVFEAAAHLISEGGEIDSEDIAGLVRDEEARALVSEILVSPPIYTEDSVDQAVAEFASRIMDIRLSRELPAAIRNGDMERANQLLRLKRERMSRSSVA